MGKWFCHKFYFLISISLKPDNVHLWCFKLKIFDRIGFIDWNIKGLWYCVAKIMYTSDISNLEYLIEQDS